MATMPEHYYNRFDASKNYDQHLFRAGFVMQSAEFNEVQSASQHRLKTIADALLKDGEIISGAEISVDPDTGVCTCAGGAIYLRGAVRGVAPGSFTIATVGDVSVGIYLTESVITELEDAALRDPAVGMRNYQEPGAVRLKVEAVWGHNGSEISGEFYPVWDVVDGSVIPKAKPPNIDAISKAISTYDRQATGGTYIVEGLRVITLEDAPTGEQVYSVSSGTARIDGEAVTMTAARRSAYNAVPDLQRITNEAMVSANAGAQRVDIYRAPIANLITVNITAEKSATITHGSYTGVSDSLPDNSVIELVTVWQGGVTYVQGTDYRLTNNTIDWSLDGDEPSPGSTYEVTYRYIHTATPTEVDEYGFTVEGALVGTLIQTTYDSKLPRVDRLALTKDGDLIWVQGVASRENPLPPTVPNDMLLLATVNQTWFTGADRTIRNDGIKVVPMSEIEDIRSNVVSLFDLAAQQRLIGDANGRLAAATKGVFVDSFRNNAQRDAGVTQDAVAHEGVLSMPISENVEEFVTPSAQITSMAYNNAVIVSQTGRTTSMKVNPYMAFDPIPAEVTLNPAVDHAVQNIRDTWAPSIFTGSGNTSRLSRTEQVGQTVIEQFDLREIPVRFTLEGFGPSETLAEVIFDGVDVTSTVVGV